MKMAVPNETRLGVRCPECESSLSAVIDSRESSVGKKRRRKCQACGHRYTTWEMTEATVFTHERTDLLKVLARLEKDATETLVVTKRMRQFLGDDDDET